MLGLSGGEGRGGTVVLGVSGTGGIPGTPLCPGDSGEGRDCGTPVMGVGLGEIPGTPLYPRES